MERTLQRSSWRSWQPASEACEDPTAFQGSRPGAHSNSVGQARVPLAGCLEMVEKT